MLVTMMFQVKMGIRYIVIPGPRRQITVVIMLTPPRIVPRPETTRPEIQRSAPTPGEWIASEVLATELVFRDELTGRYDATQELDLDGVVARVAFTRIQ